MGTIFFHQLRFIVESAEKDKFRKYIFVKPVGKATSNIVWDLSRNHIAVACVSNETEQDWIGNFAEGIGIFNVHFAKEDCVEATLDKLTPILKPHFAELKKLLG